MTDTSNAVDAFINAIVDGLIKHERFNAHIAEVVSKDGFTDDHLHEQIETWMSHNFEFHNYGFNIDDYRYEIDGMIDGQVQYLAEDGELKEWLDLDPNDNGAADDVFRRRVFAALDNNYDIRLVNKGHS